MEMKRQNIRLISTLLLFGFLLSCADNALGASDKSDKTGTNPINFTYDLKLYNEFSWMKTSKKGFLMAASS
jgi:hypothetical protein